MSSSSSSSSSNASSLVAPVSPNKSVSPDGGAQRFFSQGKRIPKDVKRHCGMCKQHGVIVETRGHTCEYKNCSCEHCDLVRKRREIMSTQIRLRREQDKKFQRTTDINEANVFPGFTGGEQPEEKAALENMNMCYFCQKCKNHNVLVWKKNHKKECQFANCDCEQCMLIDSRRALDRHIKKRRMNMKDNGVEATAPKSPKKDNSTSNSTSSSSLSSSSCSNSDESASSSDCSLSGLLSEKLSVKPQVQMKFDFSTGGFIAPSAAVSTSPSGSPFETSSPMPLLLSNSPVPMALPQVSLPPTSLPLPFLTVPSLITSAANPSFFTSPLMYSAASNIFSNPFLMPMAPIDMQMLFQNIQNLREMTAAISMANSD
ncbi:CBN-DMD-8 protein [Caenorhabditis brenneri]|uniref:CBN-DMD-8 protein n=1 Tax=Caenorhabditis brenneri TaxID=135651 RepID=G0NEU1_CAEBE|nr:CBN-DMD-8 protein [Caenorhabditis brenneri]